MQEKVQFTGIVVKNLDYQDNAQIVYILTKDELISVIKSISVISVGKCLYSLFYIKFTFWNWIDWNNLIFLIFFV